MTTITAPTPRGEPTLLWLVDGEWQIPDIVEKFHQDLSEGWRNSGAGPLDVIVYIQEHRPT